MSFFCDNCGFRNNQIEPASEIQEQGIKIILKLTHVDDLQRQVVKSDSAVIRIEDLDLEIPEGRGRLTNIEGIINDVMLDLKSGQKQRRKEDLAFYEKIEEVTQVLFKMGIGARLPFVFSVNDPTGNSSIEPSPSDAAISGKYISKKYPRTPAQNAHLGLGDEERPTNDTAELVPEIQQDEGEGLEDVDIIEGEHYKIPVNCPGCTKQTNMLLQMVKIPHFKQVVISSIACEHCTYHTSDVKTGGEVPEKGKRITVHVKGPEDVGRDILKSETCLLKIPQCNVEVTPGSMGGRFTTVSGLLTQIRDDLKGANWDLDKPEVQRDSATPELTEQWLAFFGKIDKAIVGEMEYEIIMEDPFAGSYCQTYGEPEEDANVISEDYERTHDEEESLGLADMKTHMNGDGEYVSDPSIKLAKDRETKPE